MGNGRPNGWSSYYPAWAEVGSTPFDCMNLDASMMFFILGEGSLMANMLSEPYGVIWHHRFYHCMVFFRWTQADLRRG